MKKRIIKKLDEMRVECLKQKRAYLEWIDIYRMHNMVDQEILNTLLSRVARYDDRAYLLKRIIIKISKEYFED